jgi:hypothetical protein
MQVVGAPMTRMKIAPLNRAQARWLRGLILYTDEIIAKHEGDLRTDTPGYEELIAGLDVGRRALKEHDSRPRWRRWARPRPPAEGESSVRAWAHHMEAFAGSPGRRAKAAADSAVVD